MWTAILVTVLAVSGNNVGKVLQKQATRSLPRMTLQPNVLQQYFASPTWVIGMAVDLGGAVLMIAAFALAPVSGWRRQACVRRVIQHARQPMNDGTRAIL
jgi:hypothetical protein